MKKIRDLFWILPSSLALGLILSLLDGGTWWIGWLAYSTLLTFGLLAMAATCRSVGSSRTLLLVLLLALLLRLGLGVAFSFILPPYGNDNEMQDAGYIFRDSYQRDHQAWELAASDAPLWQAFDKSYSTDQYGGLLFVSASLYRTLSPDTHRSWLVILLAALTAAIGVGLAFKAARAAWGDKMAFLTAWILALYPESILQGSAQMREPFLITFIAMVFWGIASRQESRWKSALWMGGGLIGMSLFSPGVAVAVIVILPVWVWLSEKQIRLHWGWGVGVVGLAVVAALLLWQGLARGSFAGASFIETLGKWLKYTADWDAYLTQRASDGLQPLFDALPESLHIPLVTVYGVAQPFLPAAVFAPGVWPMRTLGILRGLGWYALLPFLLYSLRPILKTTEKHERLPWLWLWLVSWAWILLSSFRAGGDQWDNPRYRVILLVFQAVLAVFALFWARKTRDHWLGRVLLVEGVFLVVFGYWYAGRYSGWLLKSPSFSEAMVIITVIGSLILVGGWLWDCKEKLRA
ncbi:MAG: hypothetical protein AB1531_00660 [Chloroflexota bacterium]